MICVDNSSPSVQSLTLLYLLRHICSQLSIHSSILFLDALQSKLQILVYFPFSTLVQLSKVQYLLTVFRSNLQKIKQKLKRNFTEF